MCVTRGRSSSKFVVYEARPPSTARARLQDVKRRDARIALARRGALRGDMAPKAKRSSEKDVAADLASMTDAEIAARKAELRAVLAAKDDADAARSSAPAAPEADDPARAPPSEPAVRLKSFEEIMAEKRARREAEAEAAGVGSAPAPAPAPGADGVIVAPPPNLDEVRKRLEERKRKQRERAEAARAEAARRADAAKTNPSAADAPTEPTATKKESAPTTKMAAKPADDAERLERERREARRVEVAARRAAEAAKPKTTAVDANARFLAAAAARAAARKAEGEDPSKASGTPTSGRISGAGTAALAVKSFAEVMEEKKRREAERGTTPDDDDAGLTTKTMRVKTEDAEELEIKYSVKVPEARLAELKERQRRRLEAREKAAKESAKEAEKVDEAASARGTDEETPSKPETNANESTRDEAEEPIAAEQKPKPRPKPRGKKSAAETAAEDAPAEKRPRRSTRG